MTALEQDDDMPLEDLLEAARTAWLNEVHTSFPGRVESYDADAQTADIVPMVRRSLPRVDGTLAVETLPTLRAVRIAWPRAGRWFVHMPLDVGDFVAVHCCERDFTRWASSGDVGDPIDVRNHSLSFAFAVPGFYPRTLALVDTPDDALVVGRDGGATVRIKANGDILIGTNATNLVALANLVKARVDTIQAAFDTHTHTVSGAATGVPVSVIGPLADVAATHARAE